MAAERVEITLRLDIRSQQVGPTVLSMTIQDPEAVKPESGLLVSDTVHTESRTRRHNVKTKANVALDACLRSYPQCLTTDFGATASNALQKILMFC